MCLTSAASVLPPASISPRGPTPSAGARTGRWHRRSPPTTWTRGATGGFRRHARRAAVGPSAGLGSAKGLPRPRDGKPVLRSVADFKVMGRSPKRVDGIEKVTGRAKYAADLTLPGMLSARILRPPAHGAKLVSVDTTKAEKVEGLTLVNQDGLVAVLQADPGIPAQALKTIVASWQIRKVAVDTDSIFDYLVSKAPEPEAREVRGDVVAARKLLRALGRIAGTHEEIGCREAARPRADDGDTRVAPQRGGIRQ